VRTAELTQKAVRLIRLFRMEGLVDAAQERQALDEVGAEGEVVLPDASERAEAKPEPMPNPQPTPNPQPQPEPSPSPPSPQPP
jgi:hypothetical protein